MKHDMELRITSTEIIKPSSPTPQHLRTHKLSIIDQVTPNVYVPIILLYSKAGENAFKTSDHLKKSLSQSLTHYYPLAGQLKYDELCIDCDDHGVTFIESHVASKMSEVLQIPNINVLEKLLPFKPHEGLSTERTNLTIQVNYFGCSGMAIGLCFKHKVLDATTAAHFLKNWGDIARGAANIKDVIFDQASMFPVRDLSSLFFKSNDEEEFLSPESVTRRFTFDGIKIASLREKIKKGSYLDRPTRFEVVSSLVVGAVISAAGENDEYIPEHLDTIISVNLRQRINPPFPEQCVGNIVAGVIIEWPMKKKVDYCNLAEEIHRSIKTVDDQFARKFYADCEFLKFPRTQANVILKNREFWVTSWCKNPLYEVDFGWGKPVWVGTGMRLNMMMVLFDSSDGEGIEAWVGLPKKDMIRFEQNPDILAYASVNPSIF